MKNFDEKIKEVNTFIKANKNLQDKNILKSVFAVTHLKDAYFFNPFKKKNLSQTEFSGLSDKQLSDMFSDERFVKLPKDKSEILFQELYNRTITNNGSKPRYFAALESMDPNIMGFIENTANTIHINSTVIDRASETFSSYDAINKYNAGTHMFLTMVHETRHNIQNDKVIDFVLNENQTDEEKAMNAINLMYLTLDDYFAEQNDKSYFRRLNMDYQELFYEHDANYFSLKNFMDNNEVKSKHVASALRNYIENSIYLPERIYTSKDRDDVKQTKKDVEKRVQKMSDCVASYLEDFKEHIADCPLKKQVVDAVSDFIKTDDKNNSKFKTKVGSEINYMIDIARNCKAVTDREEEAYTM